MKLLRISLLIVILFSLFACNTNAKLGSKHNPIKMYFVPSMEAGKIVTSGREIADHLEETTGYKFKVAVPTSYASVVEALGTKETDIAWLATFAYVLAHEKYGAEVELTAVRQGMEKYRGQFVAQAGSGIDSIEDIEDKVIAYTDAASTSGYLYPSALLKQKGIKPARTFFAGGHPQAILAVYQGRADVGCSFWTPSDDDEIHDARRAVIETYPDVVEKIEIIGFTDWIPNDTVAFRKNFPPEMKEEIVNELLKFAKTEKGKRILYEILDIDDLVPSQDSDYDIVRKTLKVTGSDAADMLE